MIAMRPPAQVPKKSDQPSTLRMVGLVGEIGYMIAIPAVLFGFGGAYLDRTFATSPWLTIAGLALALASSALAVWHRIQPFLRSADSPL